MIPKLIHQLFWDFTDPFRMPPNSLLRNRAKLRALHPDFEHRYWNERQCSDLIREKDPSFYATYDSYSNKTKYEYMKLFILYLYGGFYFDMDIEVVHHIGPLTGLDWCSLILFENGEDITTSCMGTIAFEPRVRQLLVGLKEHPETTGVREILPELHDLRVLPTTGIDMQSRRIIPQIAKQFVADGVLLMPPQAMLGSEPDNAPLFGQVRHADDHWKVEKAYVPLPMPIRMM